MQFNKRGQELSVNTLILIILAVMFLVVLAVGFYYGWDKILPFLVPGNNVKTVVEACSFACTSQATYDFCTTSREVRVDQEITDLGKKFSGSCNELRGVKQLGLEACPSVQCKDFVYTSKKLAELSCDTSAAQGTANSRTYADATKPNGKAEYTCPPATQ